MGLHLRKASAADADFIYRVIETTMRAYIEQAWGAYSEERTRARMDALLSAGAYSIIEIDGADAGIFGVDRCETHVQLEQIFILPPYQNRGIGSTLVRRLKE